MPSYQNVTPPISLMPGDMGFSFSNETFPGSATSLLAYFRRDVPRKFYRSYNESKHLVTWLNGSTTRFGYCRNENDVYQYQGAEFLFIGIDELAHFTLKQWQFLTSRNRCPVPGIRSKMAGATNPGNIGHAWVKALRLLWGRPGCSISVEYKSCSPMLPAKLFAALALIFSACAGLAWLNPWSPLDIYLRGTYFAFGPIHVLLFCAVTSINFGVLYYAAVRVFHARWNRTLCVLHIFFFVCFGISLSIVFAVSARLGNGSDDVGSFRWLAIPWFVGILSFVISFAIFGVNLALTVVQLVRARFASH